MNIKDGSLTTMLNRKVEIWCNGKATEKNELGQYDTVETKLKEIWAAVIPQTGSLLSGRSADTEFSQTTHKIVTRYRRDLKPDRWFVYDGQRYNILYILDPYNNHERLEIFCKVVFDYGS